MRALFYFICIDISYISHQKMKFSRQNSIMTSSDHHLLNKREKNDKGETKYRYGWLHRLIYRNEIYRVNGPESESFNRRTYQKPIEELKYVTNENLGFTNRILCSMEKNKVQLYVPVYLSLKIKSIQEISLRELLARIGCVLIVFINIEGLPQKMVDHLSSHIMIQINRGESFLLAETVSTGKISLKKSRKFLTFTIRDTFPVQIYEDVFLSPFEILNLVFSVTFNSTTIKLPKDNLENSATLTQTNTSVDNTKIEYTISFNSMRHPLQIPITYAEECRLGVYDLAQRLLDYYSTNKASYLEVIDEFQQFLEAKEQSEKALEKQRSQKDNPKDINKKDQKKQEEQQTCNNYVPHNFSVPKQREEQLVMKHSKNQEKKQKKVKYFQYTHFIVPLYKFPGNAWATIFIPMFMLGLLSIFIFLQRTATVTEKLGSIATFVLGFIALVPNIKSELPPSQKISFSEIIVYVESINCMLSLLEQFGGSTKKKLNIWNNPLFLLSIVLHIICFVSSLTLLCLHYFVWEPRYNIKKGQPLSSPKTDYQSWNNPYCDQTFLKYNKTMKKKLELTKQIFEWPLSNFEKLKEEQIKSQDKIKQHDESQETFFSAKELKKEV